MVTQLSRVHDSVGGHVLESFLHSRQIDPIGHIPMLIGYDFYGMLVFFNEDLTIGQADHMYTVHSSLPVSYL